MDQMDRFVSDGNIARFVDHLRCEIIPARQETLKRLLIEEENRFGAREERLEMVERNLAESSARIDRQTRLVAELKGNGGDAVHAERTLRTFEMIRGLFERYHAHLREARERAGP
jgi:hypothetical protein